MYDGHPEKGRLAFYEIKTHIIVVGSSFGYFIIWL